MHGSVVVDFGTRGTDRLTRGRVVSIFNAAGKQLCRAADKVAGSRMMIQLPAKTVGVVIVRVEWNGAVEERAGVVAR
jgi:hypothetical protein